MIRRNLPTIIFSGKLESPHASLVLLRKGNRETSPMVGRSASAELLSGLNTLAHLGVTGNLSDDQLLDRFLDQSGETASEAFEALVARHGPMVLDVCGNILRDPHNTRDAFQATFLVLASKAASIRRRDALASWLFGVARRVALQSRVDRARRRVYERSAAEAKANRSKESPESWSELHEEIARLPERYREPVVLCYLEGLSTQVAASRLGCPHGTILSRLSRARKRLRAGLIRRGFALTGLPAAGINPREVSAAIPPELLIGTARASVRFMGQPTAGAGLVSMTAVDLAKSVLHTMMLSKLQIAGAAILACGLVLGGIATLAPDSATPAKRGEWSLKLAAPTRSIAGRVESQDGKPTEGARVFRNHVDTPDGTDPVKLERRNNVTVPDISTDKGVLCRQLLAKRNNPGDPRYDEKEVLKAMKAMKAAIDNRLHYSDTRFFTAPQAKSWFDIITAPEQFQGFSKGKDGQLVISSDIQKIIDEVMAKANSGPPNAYTRFVENAINVANNDVDDPFKNLTMVGNVEVYGGTYGWLTDGKGEPGDGFVRIPDEQGGLIAGNRFFALAKSAK
jgi:RNA polymerase sigma factor (sigma-70 family)